MTQITTTIIHHVGLYRPLFRENFVNILNLIASQKGT